MNSPAGPAGGIGRGLVEYTHVRPRALLAATLALLLTACGQKGPLYLPSARKTPVTPTPGAAAPAAVAPEATPLVPAPAPAGAPASDSAPGESQPQQKQQQQQQQQQQRPGNSPPSAAGASPPA